MKSITIALATGLAFAASAQTASAQQGFEGTWGCETSYTAFDNFGNRTGGFVQQLMMGVYPGGGVEISGTRTGIGGQSGIQAQGQWQVDQGNFLAQTQGTEQSAFGNMPVMVIVIGQPTPDGRSMSFTYENPDPTRSYIMDRSIIMCQRQG